MKYMNWGMAISVILLVIVVLWVRKYFLVIPELKRIVKAIIKYLKR